MVQTKNVSIWATKCQFLFLRAFFFPPIFSFSRLYSQFFTQLVRLKTLNYSKKKRISIVSCVFLPLLLRLPLPASDATIITFPFSSLPITINIFISLSSLPVLSLCLYRWCWCCCRLLLLSSRPSQQHRSAPAGGLLATSSASPRPGAAVFFSVSRKPLFSGGFLVTSGEFQSSSFDFSGELNNFRPWFR